MGVTIGDIAAAAAVSKSTVSRAFARPGSVNDDTRRRIFAVAKQLGYEPAVPNPTHRSANSSQIGLFIPDIANPFFALILQGIEDAAQREGYAVLLGDTPAWPDGCDQIDLLPDKLWSDIPYMKGAFFYRAVEQQIGRPMMDKVLHDFYVAHAGQSATMQQLVDSIQTVSGFDAMPLATAWLKNLGHP